ncbi:uncharacterized protein HMPREF1541_08491 [Cyphellophora europaea CBS 101466]|uniref:tRNA-splicing endonuclease subunit Sen15 domain-containing protein n=1 Tax=Cyphellophora europaea (strain CBS 101466) TaxID=1220924 RepID=W2RKF9_CYPE1|nr:uncharacterized protein HMPREF1541_08491 [Cyphellophora europaea CBS 101466]ETN36214.1 hypothetical protein HMPREF1541_08491 [Cyphellophora europaea CBS 101466]
MFSASPETRPSPSPISNLITTQTSHLPHPTSSLLALPLEILHNLQHQHSWTSLTVHCITATGTLHDFPSTTGPSPLPTDSATTTTILLSGLPPRHAYIHPDLQTLLLKHSLNAHSDLAVQREWVLPLGLGAKPSLAWLSRVFDALPLRDEVRLRGDGDGTGDGDVKGPEEEEVGKRRWLMQRQRELNETAAVERSGGGKEEVASRDDGSMGEIERQQDQDAGVERGEGNGEDVAAPQPSGSIAAKEDSGEQRWQDGKRLLLAMKGHDGMGGDGTVAYYVCLDGEVKPRQHG